ncbi:A-kinase anchor protein 17B [Latimeria chalumnae]|uniref:A-kinase anchor protein 17B n=1 Tax=Latimeria chalumnae TaxID=7897 RepID=UPI0003C10608|nr:PREDICTED: A-kinase anchor protein 17B-like [Latimeria chalumnae]XP_014348683.1 PREDICTED: A-kinase anchor protein 17B-like [Latimeria chalumnae]|eukprot:XP_006003933.1 PREDICTED: A-kinase anchor protein 17B-like [Latimeria chalumnae]
MATAIVYDTSEAVELSACHCLYLKPIAKLVINVMLPEFKEPTKSISNWEVMDKLKNMVYPDQFTTLRVSKSTMDFIRFEGEVETKTLVQTITAKLHGKTLKLNGFKDIMNIVANEAQIDFPTQEDWESFFNKTGENVDTPEEKPNTIHLEGLPCKWFVYKETTGDKPSEELVRQVFETFGKIRNIDVPMLDPYREDMTGKNFNIFNFGGVHTFEAFIQYQEYADFVNAMQAMKGMKLMYKGDDGKALACTIKVTFDTTKHLSDASVERRHFERLKLQELEQQRKEEKRREKEEEEAIRKKKYDEGKAKEKKRKEKQKRREQRQKEREEKRCLKRLQKINSQEEQWQQISEWEQRKLLLAHRRVESFRLLTVLLNSVKNCLQLKSQNEHKTEEDSQPGEAKVPWLPTRELSDVKKQKIERTNDLVTEAVDNCKCQNIKVEAKIPEVQWKDTVFEESASAFASAYNPFKASMTGCIKKEQNDNFFTITDKDKHDYDFRSLQITINQDYNAIKSSTKKDHRLFNTCHSRKLTNSVSGRKQKVYETDEFINYLLNHYESPRYARICQSSKDPEHIYGWQRVVSDNGNGFQIDLKNKYGQHFTEVRIVQNGGSNDDRNFDGCRWKITIKEMEPRQRDSKSESKNQAELHKKKFQLQWNRSILHSDCYEKEWYTLGANTHRNTYASSTKTLNQSEYEHGTSQENFSSQLWKLKEPVHKPACSTFELKDLLEEISSDSEYFNEEREDKHRPLQVGKIAPDYQSSHWKRKRSSDCFAKENGESILSTASGIKSHSHSEYDADQSKIYGYKPKRKHKKYRSESKHERQENETELSQGLEISSKKKKKKKHHQKKTLSKEHEYTGTDSNSEMQSHKNQKKKGNAKSKSKKGMRLSYRSPSDGVFFSDGYRIGASDRYRHHQTETESGYRFQCDEFVDAEDSLHQNCVQSYDDSCSYQKLVKL